MDRKLLNKKLFTIFFLIFSLGFIGCASFKSEKDLSDRELYKRGKVSFQGKSYRKAAEYFKRVLDEFPNSSARSSSLMGLGRSHFQLGEYEEAKFHFERFIEQYPASSIIDRAYFYTAMCDFKQMESHKRDQTNTHLALEGFEKVINTFPNGKYIREAKQKQKICRRQLARNLLYIGEYYFKVGAYQSVINRMDELLKNYPRQRFLDEAIFLLAESYLKEGSRKKAYEAFKSLLKKYPKSEHRSYARSRLAFLIRH